MHVYKELSFVGNKPGLDSLAKNIYTVFPMNWIKALGDAVKEIMRCEKFEEQL